MTGILLICSAPIPAGFYELLYHLLQGDPRQHPDLHVNPDGHLGA